jgi:hypothetical protein
MLSQVKESMSENLSSNHENKPHHMISSSTSSLQQEYEAQQAQFDAQPTFVRRFLEAQARKLVEAVQRKQMQASFTLPDRVAMLGGAQDKTSTVVVPDAQREQLIGGVINRLPRADIGIGLRQRLAELEGSSEASVAAAASLIRYATAVYMIHDMLPSGRSVTYRTIEGEEIPTLPVGDPQMPESAITQSGDAIVEESLSGDKRGELQVPFVPAARRFYLPQWVAFDGEGHLLVKSVNEAEAFVASMQSFLSMLHSAVSLAPFMIADPVYQQKRYGMLGQLVNQGRALAHYETDEMIRLIKRRAESNDLNRGLSVSMPYFDDQALEMRTLDFVIIPAGRIMFVPAFVVRASCEEQAKVAQDTRLSPSTRKYLLAELAMFEEAFQAGDHR